MDGLPAQYWIDAMKVILLEGILRSGYKVNYSTNNDWTDRELSHVYSFSKHRGKTGEVVIHHHAPSNTSHVEFYTQSNLRPNHKDAQAVLKTVEKAVRHHIRKVKPKEIAYVASADAKDSGRYHSGNRRSRLYDRMAQRILSKNRNIRRGRTTATNATFSIDH